MQLLSDTGIPFPIGNRKLIVLSPNLCYMKTMILLSAIISILNVSAQERANIAYIRNGAEIRLIDSNGKNDRLLWTHPDAKEPLGLFGLAWRYRVGYVRR